MTIGRNDPCPCGSGRKYKKCCQPQEAVISLEAVRTENLSRDLWNKLADFLDSKAVRDTVAEGLVQFFVYPPGDEEDDEEDPAEMAADWVAFAYRSEDGTTLCERFAATGKGLTDQERAVLRAWSASSPGFFRVEAVTGADCQLCRLPDGQVITVRTNGIPLAAGDLIAAWILPVLATNRMGYFLQAIPPEALPPLMHLVQIEMALLRRQRPAATWEELYREHWPRLTDCFSLAVVDGEIAMQITLPPGPSVRWDGSELPEAGRSWHDVARMAVEAVTAMGDWFDAADKEGVLRLWWDGALTLRPRIGRPEGWAAAVIYVYLRYVLGGEETQAEVAERFGVSAATVGSRSRELAAALDLSPGDLRYLDLMDPFGRHQWRTYCLEAMEHGGAVSDLDGSEAQLARVMRFLEQSRREKAPDGPVRQAEELIDEAWEARGLKRTRLAKKALELWPDAADAYVMLGQAADAKGQRNEALRLFEAGVKAGERALGAEFFVENVGHFYGLVESRPYMRARGSLAGCLWEVGRQEEAVAHYEEMLRLNPGDNQGVRYLLAACFLHMGDDVRLGRHLAAHADDGTAAITFTRALWQYRQSGPEKAADRLLAEAHAGNPHVAAYLLGEKRLPPEPPAYLDFGGDLEAVAYAGDYGGGWRQTPGALDWLRSRVR